MLNLTAVNIIIFLISYGARMTRQFRLALMQNLIEKAGSKGQGL
jgi:hypothetical protein